MSALIRSSAYVEPVSQTGETTVRCDQCNRRVLDIVTITGDVTVRFRCPKCESIQTQQYASLVPLHAATPSSLAPVGLRAFREPVVGARGESPDARRTGGPPHGAKAASGTHRQGR